MTTDANAPNPAATPRLVLRIVHSYMLALHAALPFVLYALYGNRTDSAASLDFANVPTVIGESPTSLALTGTAALALVAATVLPRRLARPAASPSDRGEATILRRGTVPLVVRLSLIELCSLAGFIIGILSHTVAVAVPFAVAGIAATLLSPPTPEFVANLIGETYP